MKKIFVAASALLVLPAAAHAAVPRPTPVPGAEQSQRFQPSGAYVQVYYNPAADREFTSPNGLKRDVSGDGFGVSGYFPFSTSGVGLFAMGEYSMIDYDESSGGKLDEMRLGLGYQFGSGLGAYAHYNDRDEGNNAGSDGYAVHGVYTLPFKGSPFSVYGDAGYFMLTDQADVDIDGFEFGLGGVYAITPRFAGFLDFRSSDFDVDSGGEVKYFDFRTGLRINL